MFPSTPSRKTSENKTNYFRREQTLKPRLHDSHFGYGTLKIWHADLRFLVRLLRLHDEIFVLQILGSAARLNWERHSYIQSQTLT
jgi:hypothetical protein